jgi:hypothetical protein
MQKSPNRTGCEGRKKQRSSLLQQGGQQGVALAVEPAQAQVLSGEAGKIGWRCGRSAAG